MQCAFKELEFYVILIQNFTLFLLSDFMRFISTIYRLEMNALVKQSFKLTFLDYLIFCSSPSQVI